MKILIIKLSAIGDVIHTLPALDLLRRRFPGSSMTWVVEEKAAGIVIGHPHLEKVIVSMRKQWLRDLRKPSRWYAAGKEVIAFIRELRSTRYDLVIDFQGLFKSAMLVLVSRGVHKAGYDKTRELSYLPLNHTIQPPPVDEHAVGKNLSLVNALLTMPWASNSCCPLPDGTDAFFPRAGDNGVPSRTAPHPGSDGNTVMLGERERRTVYNLLRSSQIDSSKPLVLVNAPAGWETKRWEVKKMAALSDMLIRGYGAQIMFTGTAEDSPYVNAIISFMQCPAVNAAGKTDLKELACLIKTAQLFVTTDSGPMHLAAAVGTPIVAIFGPTAPWRTGPYTAKANIVRKGLSCSPCFKKSCSSRLCMHAIEVDEVMEASRMFMSSIRI